MIGGGEEQLELNWNPLHEYPVAYWGMSGVGRTGRLTPPGTIEQWVAELLLGIWPSQVSSLTKYVPKLRRTEYFLKRKVQ